MDMQNCRPTSRGALIGPLRVQLFCRRCYSGTVGPEGDAERAACALLIATPAGPGHSFGSLARTGEKTCMPKDTEPSSSIMPAHGH
jgi:hypothetical protein